MSDVCAAGRNRSEYLHTHRPYTHTQTSGFRDRIERSRLLQGIMETIKESAEQEIVNFDRHCKECD